MRLLDLFELYLNGICLAPSNYECDERVNIFQWYATSAGIMNIDATHNANVLIRALI